MVDAPPPLPSARDELLRPVILLFLAAAGAGLVGAALILSRVPTTADALIPIGILLVVVPALAFLFLRPLLRRSVLIPLEQVARDADRIASGELDHRIPHQDTHELDRVVESVNTLASRLVDEKNRLAENVASLDETNRALSNTSRELVRAARLASVGTLAAGVAHEIGNPLAAIRSYLDVLEGRVGTGRPVDELLGDLRNEVSRIDEIVRAILIFARPGVGSASGGLPAPFDGYRNVVDRAVLELNRLGRLGRVDVQVRVDDDAPSVVAQPQHLERILSNLLRNAGQALAEHDDPRLEIRVGSTAAAPVFLKARRANDPPEVDYTHRRRLAQILAVQGAPPPNRGPRDLVIEVRDNGPGIPSAVLEEIFDPFFTTREPGQGIGLGLALTARIVGELGGSIEAENRDEGGALFRVRLPGVEDETGAREEA